MAKVGLRNERKYILNREINYNIIKTVWSLYNPRKNKDGYTLEILYDNTFGNRSGFDKVVAGKPYEGIIDEDIIKNIGLPLGIMLGDDIFKISGIREEDLIGAYKEGKPISRDEIEEQIKGAAIEVKSMIETNGINPKNNFHKLCYFCKYIKPLPEKDLKLIGLQEALLMVTPEDWEICDNQELLTSVRELLRLHIQCAETMNNYKIWSKTGKMKERMKKPLYSKKMEIKEQLSEK